MFRLQLARVWHFAVLGVPPPAELDRQIETILAAGEPVILPAEVVTALAERRAQATRRGTWVQRHFRPGEPL